MSSTIVPEIEKRRARRAYSEQAIDQETMERIFTAATLAPSCSNKQSWRYIACTDEPALEKAREALNGGNYWARKAPLLVVATAVDDFDCKLPDDRNYAQFDLGLGVMAMLLQATREGMYAHPMAGFDSFKLRENFGIEENVRVVTMIAIGYPGDSDHLNEKHLASETSERRRKPLEEVVQWNGYQPVTGE